MSISALITVILLALLAVPTAAFGALLWRSIAQAGFGELELDERLLAAIEGRHGEGAALPR